MLKGILTRTVEERAEVLTNILLKRSKYDKEALVKIFEQGWNAQKNAMKAGQSDILEDAAKELIRKTRENAGRGMSDITEGQQLSLINQITKLPI